MMSQQTSSKLTNAADVTAAADRLRGYVHHTPILTSQTLNDRTGAQLWFKCENFQRTGSFKIRGASNAVMTLEREAADRGVATHSSGNHGAALALAAQRRGIEATIVVPENSVRSKLDNIQRYGGNVVFCAATQAAREQTLAEVVERTGATPISPYDNSAIIAGQGSCAMELLADVIDLDAMITPIGGGGLISGTALAATTASNVPLVYGAEPSGADDTIRSLDQGQIVDRHEPNTICDGLRAKIGVLNFNLIQQHVRAVLPVSDEQTVAAMRLIWDVLKIVVEPSCATALAVILGYPDRFRGQRIGVILSGGNVDLERLPWRCE